jgi:hypothetical protein
MGGGGVLRPSTPTLIFLTRKRLLPPGNRPSVEKRVWFELPTQLWRQRKKKHVTVAQRPPPEANGPPRKEKVPPFRSRMAFGFCLFRSWSVFGFCLFVRLLKAFALDISIDNTANSSSGGGAEILFSHSGVRDCDSAMCPWHRPRRKQGTLTPVPRHPVRPTP